MACRPTDLVASGFWVPKSVSRMFQLNRAYWLPGSGNRVLRLANGMSRLGLPYRLCVVEPRAFRSWCSYEGPRLIYKSDQSAPKRHSGFCLYATAHAAKLVGT